MFKIYNFIITIAKYRYLMKLKYDNNIKNIMIKYNIIQDKYLWVKCFLFYNVWLSENVFSWQLFVPVTSLAKLRDNCETKQKIEFSVEHLSKNLNYLFQHEEEIVWMPRKPKYDILGCYRSCRISDKTKIRLGKVFVTRLTWWLFLVHSL